MSNELINTMGDEIVRFEQVFYLPSFVCGDAPDNFQEFLEDAYGTRIIVSPACAKQGELLLAIAQDEEVTQMSDMSESFLQEAYNREILNGFLVQAATPVRSYSCADWFGCSWGYYSTQWILAETIDKACEMAIEWSQSRQADWKQKAGEE